MLDPVGGFRRIQDFFISYIETSFRIADPSVSAARRRLLELKDVFATIPLLEPVLRYKSHPFKLEELIELPEGPLSALPRASRVAFVELVLSGLFKGDASDGEIRRVSHFAPYIHQVQMLERGLRSGQPGIVTSGTGSGKTESFMLPLLAAITNEALGWLPPPAGYLNGSWWSQPRAPWVAQRQGETRPAAIRALILYPMNALVEDQMVRLRRTLASDEATAVMKDRFSGNRIFFGQYTGATPVTGYERHPRISQQDGEKQRRSRKLRQLRVALQGYERDQAAAREFDRLQLEHAQINNQPFPDQTRFIFPSLNGSEMSSRWDMHVTPPDILVTNASMLGTMLSREVEQTMFEQTRNWLLSDDDAYFYLVFDELHLIRGSAGTELSFLVKSLIQRLGLDQASHRHKLRILASSASLPIEGERGYQSKRYLRDLFAPFGTSTHKDDAGSEDIAFWESCVVRGEPDMPTWEGATIPSAPFIELLKTAQKDNSGFVSSVDPTIDIMPAVETATLALGLNVEEGLSIGALAEAAAAILTQACRDGESVRATTLHEIAVRVFPDIEDAEEAVRGLLLARALPEIPRLETRVKMTTPSFRLHCFVRNIEGLFASPFISSQGDLGFRNLGVERGMSHAAPALGEARGARLFELLYCEACGDLLIGGQRGASASNPTEIELLPTSTELESLPEKAAAEYYDRMSFAQFAVFWPKQDRPNRPESNYDSWDLATLHPATGVIKLGLHDAPGAVIGHLYFQTDDAVARGGVKSAQPFCCPKCGTDYSNRPISSRSRSPIRAFRTGVSKASQLVATELFELLYTIGADPKCIVFSDSRQDAANQALEIERLHLRDLRREILISVTHNYLELYTRNILEEGATMALIAEHMRSKRTTEAASLMQRLSKQMSDRQVSVPNRKVQLERIFHYQAAETDSVGELISEYVRLGVHPFDEVGRKPFKGRPWYQAFVSTNGRDINYSPTLSDSDRQRLSVNIFDAQAELVDDVIFANTFFSLEETGLAYPSLSADSGPAVDRLDAWLRVFASATRVRENKYFDEARFREWTNADAVPYNNRVARFARALFGDDYRFGLNDVLEQFRELGHHNGTVRVRQVFLRLAVENDSFWRCTACERVHMHHGTGICTRCYAPLPERPQGVAGELWNTNFLGRRIIRGQKEGVRRFRLRCEELTGQTDDFAARLRQFKGIFVVDEKDEISRRAREIDMLSVTTTMEVGIDIGSLQSIYQANMPPQRFNYQQRVGRSGRRGQAFSLVLTFCRGRSHDAYYFAHPEAITGDAPPPPFLAVDHDPIPMRLLRKVWLRAAFGVLRDACAQNGTPYPGDELVPPDVHGEYVPTDSYYDVGNVNWPERLRAALAETVAIRDQFITAATIDLEQRSRLSAYAQIDKLLDDIERQREFLPRVRKGLAEYLAERGLLPMYGMPTRVRQLYLGLRPETDERHADYEWSTMDRDVDMAVFEFAPGSVLTKDKQRHEVVGFTGQMLPPERRGRTVALLAPDPWCESEHFVALCPVCGSANYAVELPSSDEACPDCSSNVACEQFLRYVTPAAFRTDYRPEHKDLDITGKMATRTVATVLHECSPIEVANARLLRGAGVTIMQLNDGPDRISDQTPARFTVGETSDTGVPLPPTADVSSIDGIQAIDVELLRRPGQTRWGVIPNSVSTFGLISMKQTDALYLELAELDPRLTLNRVARRGPFAHLPTRAAAISATQILVQKAAIELDISADEFEALEPRLRNGRPMLQIADSLINGSGFSRRLGADASDGVPNVIHLIHQIVNNELEWPLVDFLKIDRDGSHAERCRASCYRCIQRYSNRAYHGLLDWRLGLAYLRAMVSAQYTCGLSQDEALLPEVRGWKQYAFALAESAARMRPETLTAGEHSRSGLPSLSVRGKQAPGGTILIVHPLWLTEGSSGIQLAGGDEVRFIDSFELERRPLQALEMASLG